MGFVPDTYYRNAGGSRVMNTPSQFQTLTSTGPKNVTQPDPRFQIAQQLAGRSHVPGPSPIPGQPGIPPNFMDPAQNKADNQARIDADHVAAVNQTFGPGSFANPNSPSVLGYDLSSPEYQPPATPPLQGNGMTWGGFGSGTGGYGPGGPQAGLVPMGAPQVGEPLPAGYWENAAATDYANAGQAQPGQFFAGQGPNPNMGNTSPQPWSPSAIQNSTMNTGGPTSPAPPQGTAVTTAGTPMQPGSAVDWNMTNYGPSTQGPANLAAQQQAQQAATYQQANQTGQAKPAPAGY